MSTTARILLRITKPNQLNVLLAGRCNRSISTLQLSSILQRVESGALKADEAELLIQQATTVSNRPSSPSKSGGGGADIDTSSFANLDLNRAGRVGFPEAIFASGKTPLQVATILDAMAKHVNESIAAAAVTEIVDEGNKESAITAAGRAILATRVDLGQFEKVSAFKFEEGEITYHETARIISMRANACDPGSMPIRHEKKVVVACAGTTDLPVAEEAAITLEETGVEVDRVYDCGVAGLHRIINALPTLRDPQVGCVIVCAGMDGALPSVVGGLVGVPVIAVPTSIGTVTCFNFLRHF